MSKAPKLRFKEFSGDWHRTTLKQVTNSFEYGMNAAATEFDGKNKYIRITDIDENTSKYLNENVVSPLGELEEKYLVKENDILFARTGASTGKTYLYDSKDGKLYFAGFLIRANVNNDNNAKFIFLQTKTRAYDKWVKVMSMRSGQPGINSQEYASYSFYAPSKEEQEKIASFFSLIDDKISLRGEKLEMLKDYKRGMMQKIFSRELRFKDDEGRDYPEWNMSKAKDLFESISDKNHNGDLEVLSATQDRGVIPRSELNIDIKFEQDNLVSYKKVKKDDFIISLRSFQGGIEHSAYTGLVSPAYTVFNFKENINFCHKFFAIIFKSTSFINRLNTLTYGIRDGKAISFKDFSDVKLEYPSKEEQEKIAEFFSNIDLKIEKEQEKLDSLNEYKKGLLQQMFV